MVRMEITQRSRMAFEKQLAGYRKAVGKRNEEAIRELAAVAARELADNTQPWGLSAAVGKRFVANIEKQVYKAIRKGNVEGMPGDAETVHNAYRHRGRVNFKGKAPGGQFKRAPVPKDDVRALVKRRQEQAGAIKAAWIAAGRDLGLGRTGRVPKWIERHVGKTKGQAMVKINGIIGTTVILWNRLDYSSNVTRQSDVRRSLHNAYGKQARRMKVLIAKAAK